MVSQISASQVGGGQILLGLAATALGLIALWGLIWIEQALPREDRATFVIELDGHGLSQKAIRLKLLDANLSLWVPDYHSG